ncbi:MAG: phosphate ABC transporter permease subunit PstC [Planctomycetota bacterium]|nr:phosphate ABC transporter permease subunit PstC [Planctomycetota bacterium]MDA1105487.1 phosphate ABC transporter permease subunit PstC [Planctomycetota bacterium]
MSPSDQISLSHAARRGRLVSRRSRLRSEAIVRQTLFGTALLSVATTAAIMVVLAIEAFTFFMLPDHPEISLGQFVTGTEWSPLLGAQPKFGVLPLVSGTLLITGIAALVALPLGLIIAIFLSEYAPRWLRTPLKATLELLAGVPTVVYGFFALTFITPDILQRVARWATGEEVFGTYNALSAGIAVGIMILPIVCSLSEDALRSVPRSLRDGAYALGSTKFDTSVRVVLPAALSGIVAACLLAVTRAVGETMIVALAAGSVPQLTMNPASQSQTMTGYMVQIFLGDAPAGGVEYQSAYAVAATLFLITLALAWGGAVILKRFREEYE